MSGNQHGKFINAFQSIQMIGDYEQSSELEVGEDSQDKIEQNINKEIETDTLDDKNESIYNGEELYNPLDMDESSNEPTETDQPMIVDKGAEIMQNLSPISADESKDDNSVISLNEKEFSLEKSPEKNTNDAVSFFDDDELLGTALAELEEEEKQMQKDTEEKGGKKKKKKKDKEKEKEDKKKKKKKKKKKGKDKIKDKDEKDEHKERKKEDKKSIRSRTTSETSISKEKEKEKEKEKKEKKKKKDKKKDKKPRDASRDRDGSKNNKYKHSNSKESTSSKNSKREKDRHSDRYDHQRKRSHRSISPEHTSSKRSRHPDNHDKKAEPSREHKHRQSSRSPSSRSHSQRERKHSFNKSRNENEHKSPRNDRDKKSHRNKSDTSNTLLSKEQFDEIQKEAKKKSDLQRQPSSESSNGEQQRLVIEGFENDHKSRRESNDRSEIKLFPSRSKSKSPHSTNKTNNLTNETNHKQEAKYNDSKDLDNHSIHSIDFKMDVENDMYDVAVVSSQSESDSVYVVEANKSSKPGALSIDEYKERRKSGKDSRLSSSSQSEEEVRFLSNDETNAQNQKTSEKKKDTVDETSLYDIGNFDESIEKDDKSSIPLFNESKENIEPVDEKDDHDDSPYNPEASPLDFGSLQASPSQNGVASPSHAAVEDVNVDILAYKDVLAFEDIMKSKVKHEAKKHKRKKLEEMKLELADKDVSHKDKRLVDYLLRQAKVEELMKNTLKDYFKSREITKEEYKYILKKAVPQVTMSGSSIVPEKIESLMVKFVRKCKGQRAKEAKDEKRKKQRAQIEEQQKDLQQQIQTNEDMLNSLGNFEMKVLNPNLPLPPI